MSLLVGSPTKYTKWATDIEQSHAVATIRFVDAGTEAVRPAMLTCDVGDVHAKQIAQL
jgi:hypothetical protein